MDITKVAILDVYDQLAAPKSGGTILDPPPEMCGRHTVNNDNEESMSKISPRELIDNLVNRFGEFQFGMTIDPTTGKAMPTIGGTLRITDTDRRRALKLLAELEKRRILYEKVHAEQVEWSIQSVIQIRDFISKEIIIFKRKTRLTVYANELIEACQEFLGLTQRLNGLTGSYYTLSNENWRIFRTAIKRLRKVFARSLCRIVTEYNIDIDDRLARIIPVSPTHDDELLQLSERDSQLWE